MFHYYVASMISEYGISESFYLYKNQVSLKIGNLHVSISILHVDIVYLACRRQNMPPQLLYSFATTQSYKYVTFISVNDTSLNVSIL